MKVLISGSTGLIGSALVTLLTDTGHEVVRLVRSAPRSDGSEVHWDPESERIDTASLEGMDAVVHLAGENIGAGRWTRDRKARIFDSRVKGTRLLCESLVNLNQPPPVLVCASAIGFYGSRGKEVMNEGSESGAGFLADVCREWGDCHRVHRSDRNPRRKPPNGHRLESGRGTIGKDAASLQNGSRRDIG